MKIKFPAEMGRPWNDHGATFERPLAASPVAEAGSIGVRLFQQSSLQRSSFGGFLNDFGRFELFFVGFWSALIGFGWFLIGFGRFSFVFGRFWMGFGGVLEKFWKGSRGYVGGVWFYILLYRPICVGG